MKESKQERKKEAVTAQMANGMMRCFILFLFSQKKRGDERQILCVDKLKRIGLDDKISLKWQNITRIMSDYFVYIYGNKQIVLSLLDLSTINQLVRFSFKWHFFPLSLSPFSFPCSSSFAF